MTTKPLKSISALTAGGLLLTACAGSSQQETEEPTNQAPNIVVFLTDDNAHSYWGYGGGPDLSPTIDQIAADGVECTEFYTPSSVCTPSRYAFHTGKFAGRCEHEIFQEDYPDNQPYNIAWNTFLTPDKDVTIGDVLRENGYNTAFVGKWHLGSEEVDYGLNLEDDPRDPEVVAKLERMESVLFDEIRENGYDYVASVLPQNFDNLPVAALHYHNLEWIAKGAIELMDSLSEMEKPFFMVVNITTHHGPCHTESIDQDIRLTPYGYRDGMEGIMPPRETIYPRIEEAGYEVNFHTAGTVWTDDMVKAMLDKLDDTGEQDETALVFLSDHNRYDGKATCYQGGVNAPFLMKYPGVIEPGTVSNNRFMMIDMLPTFAEIAGLTEEKLPQMDGKSAWNAIKNPEKQVLREYSYFEMGYTRAVLSEDGYKYVAVRFPDDLINNIKDGFIVRNTIGHGIHQPTITRYPHLLDAEQLYYIPADPDEQVNLADDVEYSEKLDELKTMLETYTSTFENPFPIYDPDPFYESDTYTNMKKTARETLDMDQFYWYRDDCY